MSTLGNGEVSLTLSEAIERVYQIGDLNAQLLDGFTGMSPDEREAFTRDMAADSRGLEPGDPKLAAMGHLLGKISLVDARDEAARRSDKRLRLVFEEVVRGE